MRLPISLVGDPHLWPAAALPPNLPPNSPEILVMLRYKRVRSRTPEQTNCDDLTPSATERVIPSRFWRPVLYQLRFCCENRV
jgi:hypothetical protein